MIPIRDKNPTARRPIWTWTFIAMNVAVFVYQMGLGEAGMQMLVERFGVVPAVLTGGDLTVSRSALGAAGALVTPFTSMFLHGGLMHLAGNMWFLYVFGDNVEDTLGRGRFVLFYLLCGLAAVIAQVAVDPSSTIPMVGASGAISGVLAGYVRRYPRARIVTLIPIIIIPWFVEVPAFVFIVLWFGLQLFQGVQSLGTTGGGVAFFAHIGGFVAGLFLIGLLKKDGPRRARAVHVRAERGPYS
ncbi:MAG: rhomboid family intramembrane serine protease [Myxococcota bacterium]